MMASPLQIRLAATGNLHTLERDTHLRIARGARKGAERVLAIGRLKLRGDVRASGLGDRLANTWRAEIYPRSANARTHAPSITFRVNDRAKTKRSDSLGNTGAIASAADIIKSHTTGATIVHRSGLYLAIPTKRVPRKGRRLATPQEVEEMFDQDLIFKRGPGQQVFAFVDPSRGRSKGRRKAKLILMFVMVRQVRLRARLHWPRIFQDLGRDWQTIVPAEIAAELAQGAAANVQNR